ncbi:MAG: hypothetical protein CL878_07155 [Dehalococcoidia bacterium]|nr:hypothetical protein [Dehalococcoidia bacterium]
MGRTRWAYLAAIFSCWGWASLYPGSELVLDEVGPFIVVWARAAVAGLALALLTCVRARGVRAGLLRLRDEIRAQPIALLVLGTLAFGVTSSFSVSSQVFLAASIAALLVGIGPLWLALGAALLGHAAQPRYLVGGSLLACVGVGVVVLGQDTSGAGTPWWMLLVTADWRGVALALTGSVAIAASMLLARRVLAGRDAVAITAVACCWAALLLIPVILVAGQGFSQVFVASRSTHLILVYLGLGSTAFNFALWYFALSQLPITRIAHFQYLVPLLGVLLSVLILGEPLTASLVVGGGAILVGIIVAQRGAGSAPRQAGAGQAAAGVSVAPLPAASPSEARLQ